MTRRLLRARRWTPPRAVPDRGATAPLAVERLSTGGHGPEDVAVDAAGRIVTGLADGRVVRLDPATGERTLLGDTGGRPLGLHLRADGGVLVCDHDRGLLAVRPDGAVDELVTGVPFVSNVVEAPDGTIWFTTSTSRWSLDEHLGDFFEHSGTGTLRRLDPGGTVRTVLSGLKFANGLVLAPDGSLLVAETAGYRILRHRPAGATDVLVDNLPGFPDNMSLGGDGLLWVALAAPRNALLDRLLPLPGPLRTLVWNLPAAVRPGPAPIAWVLAFDLDGRLVHDLRATDGSYGFVTSVAEHDGTLVLGSLTEDDVALTRTPTGTRRPQRP